ncbi:MAG: hypothetical protein D6820_14985 [Lentisphaerae bacterium]|nr:MAG: hypothetical protein D6820_14985 [Lentisphaerota bacterium]
MLFISSIAFWVGLGRDRPANLLRGWWQQSLSLSTQILPAFLVGTFLAGFFFGFSSGNGDRISGLIPASYGVALFGNNGVTAILPAVLASAMMYLVTFAEIPVVDSLRSMGVAAGPLFGLLLAGPSLSLPGMILLFRATGGRLTILYFSCVITLITLCAWLFSRLW